jgi:hypothetical protein
VEQLPRQAEEERGRFPGGRHLGLGGARFERRIHVYGEAAAGMTVDLRPAFHHFHGMRAGHRGVMQELSACHEARLDLPRGPGNTR